MSFSQDILKFEEKALLSANHSVTKVTTELFKSIVALSPSKSIGASYSNDLFINQWYPSVGGFSASLNSSQDGSGAMSISRINSSMASKPFLGKDNMITLTNNLGYAYRIEELGWPKGPSTNGGEWKGSTPYKMVSKSVQQIKGLYP